MLDYNTMGACVLVLTLATFFLIIPMTLRAQRTEKGVGIWLLSGLTGILLGAGGAAAGVQLMGYGLEEKAPTLPTDYYAGGEEAEDEEDGERENSGMEDGGGRGMGGGSGMGGGRGGARGPSAKGELTTLVRKIDLLTGDVALNLSADQTTALTAILVRLDSQDTMADDDAKAAQEEILAILDDTQKAKQDAVGLPRSGGSRGGRGGPGADGGQAEPDANPFSQAENSAAMQSLLDRFGAGTSVSVAPQADTVTEPVQEGTEETAVEPQEAPKP